MSEIQAAVRTLGVEVIALPIRDAGDIASAFEGLKDRAEAIYVVGDPLTHAHCIDGICCTNREQRVTVRGCPRDRLGGNIAAGTTAVLDDNDCPSCSDSDLPINRATMSSAEPAPKPSIMRTGRVG
jgi:hypothetical protein